FAARAIRGPTQAGHDNSTYTVTPAVPAVLIKVRRVKLTPDCFEDISARLLVLLVSVVSMVSILSSPIACSDGQNVGKVKSSSRGVNSRLPVKVNHRRLTKRSTLRTR